MSHQGYPYWFPECFICGMGNLRGVVCMTPQTEEAHGGLIPIEGSRGTSEQIERDGHHWLRCLLCSSELIADPGAWGSYVFCVVCWNAFARQGVEPPRSAEQARRILGDRWPPRGQSSPGDPIGTEERGDVSAETLTNHTSNTASLPRKTPNGT